MKDERYHEMITNFVGSELQAMNVEIIWFQHDSITSHIDNVTMAFLLGNIVDVTICETMKSIAHRNHAS